MLAHCQLWHLLWHCFCHSPKCCNAHTVHANPCPTAKPSLALVAPAHVAAVCCNITCWLVLVENNETHSNVSRCTPPHATGFQSADQEAREAHGWGTSGGLPRRDSTSSFMSSRPDRGSESGLLDNLLQEGGLPVRRLHLINFESRHAANRPDAAGVWSTIADVLHNIVGRQFRNEGIDLTQNLRSRPASHSQINPC